MEKLILIDGNSLLNRAFYAMNVFTNKDGLPTNGIFGFIKLLFKILEDEKPEHLIVAFDVHSPTFRHKKYAAYKGNRKAMPDELRRQVPVLKDLLRSMKIFTIEKEGYEADDVIGTLSRRFPQLDVHIYTGDRDAYQLVKENVSVYFTKRGVSDIDLHDNENFFLKEGIEPWQIIELKALMGDSSDNIPGVRGIGPKSALKLLQSYRDLDNVYLHLDELSNTVRAKLEEYREEAFLSRELATIDVNAPVEIDIQDCRVILPFDEDARAFFGRLEFRSLMSADVFPNRRISLSPPQICSEISSVLKEFEHATEFSCVIDECGTYLWFNEKEYYFPIKENLLSIGFFEEELYPLYQALFLGKASAIVADSKQLYHRLSKMNIFPTCLVEDVNLLRYVVDSNLRPVAPKEYTKDYDLEDEHCAFALKRVFDETKPHLDNESKSLYYEVELPLARVLFEMEHTGVRIDISRFPEFSQKFGAELTSLSTRIFALAGVSSFNLNSPQQLSQILFDKLGYSPKGIKKNQKGGYSTSADVLEKLAEEHEIARLVLRYREIQKLLSTYIEGIRPLAMGDIVHTTYNQSGTTTGRLSSTNPNLQNIPVRTEAGRELRKLFIAREGHVLIDADYSQIELRLLAHFSNCKPLVEAYREGKDIHAATASQVFSVPLEAVTSDLRRRAKVINFGILYGMSSFGLGKDLQVSANEAQAYIDEYFKRYAEVRQYMDANVEFARENGYVTTILGRKRLLPEIHSSIFTTRSFGERAAMNMPLQGSSADIIKIAMLHVAQRLRREGLKTKMVLQVHDELVLDAPLEESNYAAQILKEEMENAVELRVPLTVEVSTGKSWYDAK